MPKVSIYMPTYNYGRYIEEAIQSVIKQTMDDWELIVIDDGSTDNTMEVIKQFADNPQIRIISQENKGLNVTNNIAIRLASGKYIVRLDPDDSLDENMLLVLSNVLDTKPDVGLVYPDYYIVDIKGDIIEAVRRQKIAEEVELLDLPAHGACTMGRREVLHDLGYDETYTCQDGYDLWLRAIRKYKPYNVNIPLFYYRQHSLSLTRNQDKILGTRRNIKKNYVDKFHNGERPDVLGIVPVVKHPLYSQADPFVRIGGLSLLEYTLNAAQDAEYLSHIVLAADDKEMLEFGKKRYPNLVPLLRDKAYSKSSIGMGELLRYVLHEVAPSLPKMPDAVCTLFVNCPLRRSRYIDKAIDTMVVFDVDTVISVEEELAFCYQHKRHGLSAISAD
ncbi:MAG: glycosyltransferase [Rectinema sp.]